MNADTQRKVEEIRERGWHPMHTTLGEGGWAAVHAFAGNWGTYKLRLPSLGPGHVGEEAVIRARDDETALAAFRSLFVSFHGCTLVQETITYREIPLES